MGQLAIDARVLDHRGPKAALDPERAYATTWEEEADGQGGVASTAVVFLTNRECPFRCVMCDLWTHTLDTTVPAGAVPRQIGRALAALPAARWVKLYNAGSFFDPGAIPREDDAEIARHVAGHQRVIVESHPAFLAGVYGERCVAFRDRLNGALEVAIGLETVHADVLARLNKRMTLAGFRRAADFLADEGIALRVFILLNPPFLPAAEALAWACRSIDVASSCGARVCTVIPTRAGNGAMEAMAGPYETPRIAALEAAVEYGLSLGGPVVQADLWDIDRFVRCPCDRSRVARLAAMNRHQVAPAPIASRCDRCL